MSDGKLFNNVIGGFVWVVKLNFIFGIDCWWVIVGEDVFINIIWILLLIFDKLEEVKEIGDEEYVIEIKFNNLNIK